MNWGMWRSWSRRQLATAIALASVLGLALFGTGTWAVARTVDFGPDCTDAHTALEKALARDEAVDLLAAHYTQAAKPYTYCQADEPIAVARATFDADRSQGDVDA